MVLLLVAIRVFAKRSFVSFDFKELVKTLPGTRDALSADIDPQHFGEPAMKTSIVVTLISLLLGGTAMAAPLSKDVKAIRASARQTAFYNNAYKPSIRTERRPGGYISGYIVTLRAVPALGTVGRSPIAVAEFKKVGTKLKMVDKWSRTVHIQGGGML